MEENKQPISDTTTMDQQNIFGSGIEPHVLPVKTWPNDDTDLHKESQNVRVFDDTLKQVAVDLLTTLRANNAIGLAAPQVGIKVNVLALWIEEEKPYILVNPRLTEIVYTELFEWEEGCLSVPGFYEKRKRPGKVVIQYWDIEGKEHSAEFHGIYAFAVQHEMDHLKGHLFIDGASRLKRMRIKKKIKKAAKKR